MERYFLVAIFLGLGAFPAGASIAVFGFGYTFLDIYPFLMYLLAFVWFCALAGMAHTFWRFDK
jgi:fumarate reductase subunit D